MRPGWEEARRCPASSTKNISEKSGACPRRNPSMSNTSVDGHASLTSSASSCRNCHCSAAQVVRVRTLALAILSKIRSTAGYRELLTKHDQPRASFPFAPLHGSHLRSSGDKYISRLFMPLPPWIMWCAQHAACAVPINSFHPETKEFPDGNQIPLCLLNRSAGPTSPEIRLTRCPGHAAGPFPSPGADPDPQSFAPDDP